MKFIQLVLLFFCVGNIFSQTAIFTDKAPKPIGPYSQAILKGDRLYVSGQIAINPVTNLLDTASIESETVRVLENIKAILTEAKMDISNIVKTTIYLSDLKYFSKVNDIYQKYFIDSDKPFPARETIQAAALPRGVRIEISVIAEK